MNCDEIRDVIPAFVQREVNGEERIRIKKHLGLCNKCREKYLIQLKLNYSIDRESVLNPEPIDTQDLKPEIMRLIDSRRKNDGIKYDRWIWYVAAAILIIGFIVGRLTIHLGQTEPLDKASISLSQLLASENWSKLEDVLTDHTEFNKYASDHIPIHVLLDKLLVLRRLGVQKISIIGNASHSTDNEVSSSDNYPGITVSINKFIQVLEHAKQQRSQITLSDVSDMLTTI